MSRKLSKSDLSRADISLLINSEEAKNNHLYGNLYDILLQIKDLRAISLDELKCYNLNHGGIAALTYNRHTLIDNATREWRAATNIIDNPKRTAACQLCNAPKLRYECYIYNIKNGTELLVGSECVNHFKIDGYLNQKKQLAQIHIGQKIAQRKNEFYSRFPDYEDFIFDAERYFSTLPILLPYKLYISLEDTISRMKLIAVKYVNEGKKPYDSKYDSFDLFRLAVDNYQKLKTDSDNYVNINIGEKFVCKRPEMDWLLSQNNIKLLHQISENGGVYTLDTLKKMYSYGFMQKHIDLFVAKNHSKIIKFERLSDKNLIFSFNKFGYQPPILFIVRLKEFMMHIGAYCIFDDNFFYTSKDILPILTIIESKSNIISILGYIDNMMNLFNCTFLVDDTTNSLYLYRRGDKAVRAFSDVSFIRNYCKYILLSDEQIKKYLYAVIRGSNKVKWITFENQAKYGIADKIGMLYKDYKDSHEYNFHPAGSKFELITYGVGNNPILDATVIDFDAPEYIAISRNKIKINDSQLHSIEYGLYIRDDTMTPFYQKGDLLLIQASQKFKNDATVFFASAEGIEIRACFSESGESESIFKFTDVPKNELIAYGRIVYCLYGELTNEDIKEAQLKAFGNELRILVVDNPKRCIKCSRKCTYKLIDYIEDENEIRKINVAVCQDCKRLYVNKNFYLMYKRSKKKSNIVFELKK